MASGPDLSAQRRAERAAASMFQRDRASQALGMRVYSVGPGCAEVHMRVRADMLNGHGVCHGGFVFALADSAFAFACNSYNEATLAAAAQIDFLRAAAADTELIASARELWRGGRSGLYEIEVRTADGERIAFFRGRSYRVTGTVTEEG
jgi:acyl-CoA thioesterase